MAKLNIWTERIDILLIFSSFFPPSSACDFPFQTENYSLSYRVSNGTFLNVPWDESRFDAIKVYYVAPSCFQRTYVSFLSFLASLNKLYFIIDMKHAENILQ